LNWWFRFRKSRRSKNSHKPADCVTSYGSSLFRVFIHVRSFLTQAPTLTFCLLSVVLGCAANAADPASAFFTEKIQPILELRCYDCHSHASGKMKGGLTLDSRSGWADGGGTGPAVVPGKPEESILIQAVRRTDPDLSMPPKKALPAEEVALLVEWVQRGAPDPRTTAVATGKAEDWWSLQPLVKPALAQPGIDRFISVKLAEKGLALAPAADARTLCRRLYFDLTGLPPTPEELEAFAAASARDADGAYERLVDQLLASPRYGERWARHWLDVVHYGDTHGYDKDQPRPNAWPYRDYVIRAFNGDKPYARFVQEELAGDVLFPGTQDGIEALGFIAAGPWDFIGHAELPEEKIDGQVARHLDRDDMVGNAMGTFTSATIQCAQCHNHKFDPFTQEDYYALQAVFAALDRADKSYDLDPPLAEKRRLLTQQKAELEARAASLAADIAKAAGPELAPLEKGIATAEKAASQGRRPEYGWHSAIERAAEQRQWVQVDLGRSVALDRVVLAGVWDDFNGIGPGFGFPVRFRIEASDDPQFGGVPLVLAANDLEDYPNPGTAPQTFPANGKTARYVRVTATRLALRKDDYIFALAELQAFDVTGKNLAAGGKVTSSSSIEAPVRWTRQNLTDGIYPAATGGGEQLATLRQKREALVRKVDAALLRARAENAAALAVNAKAAAQLPPAHVVYAGTVHTGTGNFRGTGAKGGAPRVIHLLARGQVTAPGREVGPGALSALKMLPGRFELPANGPEGERRAALARWITDRANPLTWRSIVNRVWQYHFGRGLVDTPNDFGRMGARPTHPELLDWLALEFRDTMGGSLKQLHKRIVMSATYRQSSAVDNPPAAQLDVNNTLLWRQNRRKLEAEAVRDSVLAVSGKLDLAMGGPGWQDFVVEHPEHSPHYEYALANPDDAKTWRRGIYRFIVRSQMQPFMTSLDCADPSMRVDKRNESVSPTQALALLNNGFMLAQSTHFAERLQREAGPELAVQIDRGYRLALGHAPSAEDKAKLVAFAQQYGLPNLCRVLFNLNEFAFVD